MYILYSLSFALSLTTSRLYQASRLPNCLRLSEPGSKTESKYIKISDIREAYHMLLN